MSATQNTGSAVSVNSAPDSIVKSILSNEHTVQYLVKRMKKTLPERPTVKIMTRQPVV